MPRKRRLLVNLVGEHVSFNPLPNGKITEFPNPTLTFNVGGRHVHVSIMQPRYVTGLSRQSRPVLMREIKNSLRTNAGRIKVATLHIIPGLEEVKTRVEPGSSELHIMIPTGMLRLRKLLKT